MSGDANLLNAHLVFFAISVIATDVDTSLFIYRYKNISQSKTAFKNGSDKI